jgi:hypothetical protein
MCHHADTVLENIDDANAEDTKKGEEDEVLTVEA